ncbi:MAG: lipid-A-disaccharide synthase [Rhodobacteraceae bacterium]|nr:lipid-A-disaccharide synthase [Paracoccaceae bacterium]
MKVFIIAGEASGDKLGTEMMKGLQHLGGDKVQFAGVGGAGMIGQGLASLFPMDQISIMGIGEILFQYQALKRYIQQTVEAVLQFQPDVLITIDLPEFNLRVARQVKARSSIRTVHYVAPTVWAWRPKRAAKMAPYIDQVLALFPFEPPYMRAAGMQCEFVGHPVVTDPQATPCEVAAFRKAHDIDGAPLLLVLPGSRRSEVLRLLPVFGATVTALVQQHPALRVVVPTVSAVAGHVQSAVAGWPGQPIVLAPQTQAAQALHSGHSDKRAAFAAADVALAASGTVSLELAAAATPMVIAYDMAWLSRQIIGRMLRVDTVTLVNLVSETRVVPEFIGANCRPDKIVPALAALLSHPEDQHNAMQSTMTKLGQGGTNPGIRAAQATLSGLGV